MYSLSELNRLSSDTSWRPFSDPVCKGLAILLGLGFGWQLIGMMVAPSFKMYHQIIEAFFWFPTAVCLVLRPRLCLDWVRGGPALLLLFGLWSLLSLQWTPDSSLRYKEFLYLFLACQGAMLLARLSIERFLQALVLAAWLAGCLCWYAVVDVYMVQRQPWGYRILGPGQLDSTIWASQMMGMLFWILISLRDHLPGSLRSAGFWTALLGLVTYMLCSMSKGPLLGLLVSLILTFMLLDGRRGARLGLAIIGLALGYVLLFPEYALRGGSSYRVEIWGEAVKIWLEHPWLGQGPGTDYLIRNPALPTDFEHAHNFFLDLLVRQGLVGLGFWSCILAWIGRTAWRLAADPCGRMLFGLLICATVPLLTDGFNLWDKPNELWALLWLPVFIWLVLPFQLARRDSSAV